MEDRERTAEEQVDVRRDHRPRIARVRIALEEPIEAHSKGRNTCHSQIFKTQKHTKCDAKGEAHELLLTERNRNEERNCQRVVELAH